MKRRKLYGIRKRITAGFLAITMCCSLFTGMSFTSYATEDSEGNLSSGISLEESTSGNVSEDTSIQDEQNENTNTGDETSEEESADDVTKDPEDTSGETDNDGTDEGNNDNDSSDNVNNDDVNNDNDSESIDNDENDMSQDSEDEEVEIGDLETEEIPREEYESDIETYGLDSDLIEQISHEDSFEENGQTVYYLYINDGFLPEGQEFTQEVIEAVIEHYGNKLYSLINLELKSEDDNQIKKELYNACVSHLLNDSSAQIYYTFYDRVNNSKTDYYYIFINPKKIDNDIDANVYFEVTDSEIYFNIPKKNAYVGYADQVIISFFNKKAAYVADALSAKSLSIGKYCLYDVDSDNHSYISWGKNNSGNDYLSIDNAEKLTGTKYRIDEGAYEEYTNGSYISLTIEPQDQNEYKDGEVKKKLEQFHSGKKYDRIQVRIMKYDESDWKITHDVYNAVIPYLKDGGEIEYFVYISGKYIYWYFQNPSEISTDSSPAANLSVTDGKASVQIKDISNISAESIRVYIDLNSQNLDIKTSFDSILGDSGRFSLYEGNSETPVEDVRVVKTKAANYSEVNIYGVEKLKEDVTYTIDVAPPSAYEEHDLNGYMYLSIEPQNGNEYKDGEVKKRLEQFHSGKKYDDILVGIKGNDESDWKITPDIFNAVIPYLKNGGRIVCSGYIAGRSISWYFQNPSEIETESSPTATLSVTDGKAAVQMKGIENINAESIRMYQNLTGDIKTQFDNLLGDSGRFSLYEENSETPVEGAYVNWTKYNSRVDIYGVEKLKEDVTYTFGEYTYRGDVYEYDGGKKRLVIESSFLKKDKFDLNDLKSIINWYVEKGEKFDQVTIVEKYSTSNLIKKDYFNLAASILKDENSSLTFCFSLNQGITYDTLLWTFSDCRQGINKDINGNVTYMAAENYGVTFQLNAVNTYPSGKTEVEIFRGMRTSVDEIRAALGAPESVGNGEQLAVLKGTTTLTDLKVSYTGDRNNLWLNIGDVSKWAAKTKYTIMPIHETAGFNVGESIELAKLSGKLDYPEGVADAKWASLTTDLISVADGKLSALDEGEGYVLLSYKSGKNSCLRLYCIPISKRITRIAMDKELTMDLEYAYGTEGAYKNCTEELELKIYPADAGCDIYDPKEIKWESSKEDVVEIVTDENGRFMYIRALKPGEAVITASYIGNIEDGSKPTITASCKVTVRAPIKTEYIPGGDNELYAVTNFDTVLSAVELPDGWEWANGATPLSSFDGMESSIFPAVYTDAESGRTENHNLSVRMITVTGIRILQVFNEEKNEDDNEDYNEITKEPELFIAKENKQTVTYAAELLFASGSPMNEEEWSSLSKKMEKAGYHTEWSSNPKNLGAVSKYDPSRWQFTVDSNTAKGKKTITASIQNSKNKKVFAASHSVTVTENPVVDFSDSVMDVSDIKEGGMFANVYDENTDTGTLTITIPKEKYSSKLKLTVTSKDTAILKIGTISEVKGDTNVVTTVPYERKGYGIVPVVITASDERKSSCTLRFTFVDTTPKLLTQTVTLNKKMTDKAADILIQCEKGYTVAGDVSVGADYSGMFKIECVKGTAGATDTMSTTGSPDTLKISIKDDSVKKGKYKVKITVPIKAEAADNNTDADTAADAAAAAVNKVIEVTVSVVETLPSVTVKQTKKVNTFYKDAEGYGLLSITANGVKVKDVSLDACDYELAVSDADGVYVVKPKANAAVKVKKGTLSYKLEGYDGTYTKSVTISTANTKPVIVLSQKSDTLYSGAGYRKTSLVLTEKSTGNTVSADDILVKDAADKNYKKLDPNVTIKGSNKNYYLISGGNEGLLNIQLAADTQIYSCTDKIPLRIQKKNWNSSIDVTYSVKVDTKAPKLKLSQATITLNKNADVYGYQQAETNLSLNGCSTILKHGNANVRVYFTGRDNASTNALKVEGNLVLQYKEEQGCITARFNDNELKTGSYKYNVCVEIRPDEGEVIKASTALTIKVVDNNPEKCISVSTKGSIDLLDREGTGIAVTPKLSNVTGTVNGGWLTDKDAGLFDSDFEDGKLYIRAKEGRYYSTRNTYKVKAVFWVVTGYHSYKLVSKELSFKVKQGKPKIKVSSETANTLYRTTGNEIELRIEALLGTKAVEIEEVYLVNFTDDLELVANEADGTVQNYDSDRHSVRIKATGATKNIMQNGKTQTVKLAVRYRDQAGDVKDTQITYKICVK